MRSFIPSLPPLLALPMLALILAACGDQRGAQFESMRASSPETGAAAAAPAASMKDVAGSDEAFVYADSARGEGYTGIIENPFESVAEKRWSTFSIDVDAASYSNCRRFITGGMLPPADAVRIEEMINYFGYDYPQPAGDEPFSITTDVAAAPWNREHGLVMIGLQGKSLKMEQVPPSNLVFLIDVSGSMQDVDKLPLLKKTFGLLVDRLRPQDMVSVVVYAGAAGLVLPPTSGSDRGRILAAIDGLEAGGSTAGGEGILLAYKVARKAFIKGGNNRVILATDGDFNVGVSDPAGLEQLITEKRREGVFLSVLGFGTGNLQDGTMELLADKGNGHYAYIDSEREAAKVFQQELAATLYAIAKDVKIQVEFNPAVVASYRLIGYENRMLAREDFDDDTKDAGELGAGHTVTALYEIIPVSARTGAAARPDLDAPRRITEADPSFAPASFAPDQLMAVKLRYKKPDEETSRLVVGPVIGRSASIEGASENLRFAAAVAGWGLLLRGSAYRGSATFDDVIALAQGALGKDLEGHRSEFVDLVRASRELAAGVASR